MNNALFSNDAEGRKAFEALASRAVKWISGYYEKLESLPVRSQVQPGDIYAALPNQFPEHPKEEEAVFSFLDEVLMPGITHWQHPNFYAFFPGNTSFPSIAAEMITAGIAAQCMIWESSPAAAELEQRCMEWCRDLLGLPSAWEGVIQDTASTSTLTALLTAREWKSGFRISRRGFDGTVYRVYASSQAHSSVEKAVRLSGIGTDNLVLIATDENLAMRADQLLETVLQDLQQGYIPLCVISTFGTTGTGAVDPIAEVSKIANQYGLWHHIDAAYAGTALMLEPFSYLRKGLEGADSFVFNPHKWMFVQFDCSAYFVRDRELLIRTMSINPSYLMTVHGDAVHDYRDWSIPLGRRFRALKLWMTVQLLGTEAIRSRLHFHLALAEKVETWLRSDPRFEIPYSRAFNIVTFRVSQNLDPEGRLTRRLWTEINASGKAYMTHAVIEGHSLIRWVTGQTHTEVRHIDATWMLINALADKITKE